MPSEFKLDLAKIPFTFAGVPVSGITFLVGARSTNIRFSGCPTDVRGNVVYQTTAKQAREIARDLLSHVDAIEARQKPKLIVGG
jgi:hypothetical protein